MFESIPTSSVPARLRRCAIPPTIALVLAAAYGTFLPFFPHAAGPLNNLVATALLLGALLGVVTLAATLWRYRAELDLRALASAALPLLASLGSAYLYLSIS